MMAINSFEKPSEKIGPAIVKSFCSKVSNQNSRCLSLIDYSADHSISSSKSKCDKFKKKKNTSLYLTEDRIEMLSKITEKRLVHTKTTDLISSYPLAVKIYKASSDEFKALKKRKKAKKSVLTLPNEQAPLPQLCMVSDMNDSEYYDEIKDKKNSKPKERTIQANRKLRLNKAKLTFDRDAEYCSRLNIDMDNSSTDMINQFTGDGKKSVKRRNILKKSDVNTHDVWNMLRNMNRFQFRPSPPFSENSITSTKKRNAKIKLRNNKMDTKFIETCTTEEFTFFSNSVDKSDHNSKSSIDRITVIDKKDAYKEIQEELKVVKNKIPTNLRKYKKNKKYQSNVISRLSSAKVKCDGENVGTFYQNEVNLKPVLPNSLQDEVQSQENKLMLTYDVCNNLNLGCIHNCLYCHANEIDKQFNGSDDFNHLYGNSDSSKGDIIKRLSGATPLLDDQSKANKLSTCVSKGQIHGITKVVLSKGQDIVLTKKVNLPKRKLRLVTTMPSAVLYPKLTQADIKRRLANIKFPLVILSKDQLTSTPFQVPANHEPPHLAGLNEHIWPFMQSWQKRVIANPSTKYSGNYAEKTTQGIKGDCIGEKMKLNNGTNSLAFRARNTVHPIPLDNVKNINIKAPKIKPMRQLKERMLQFLHKRYSFVGDNKKYLPQETTNRKEHFSNNLADVGTNTKINFIVSKDRDKIICKKEEKMLNYTSSQMKQPWAKGRWASEFIDNVIKKIKNGVYYNQDEKGVFRNQYCSFDENPSDLQIETINKNQVAIKHCVTNIVVQFDVAIPSEINTELLINQSISFVPVSVTQNHTKIFKSNTIIINAMLPAELCSILPNTMRRIIDSKLVLPKIFDKVENQLTSIAEIFPCKSGNSLERLTPVFKGVSLDLKIIGKGKFLNSKTIIPYKTFDIAKIKNLSFEEFYFQKKSNLLPPLLTNRLLMCQIGPMAYKLISLKSHRPQKLLPELDFKRAHQKISSIMVLQPYVLSNKQVVSACKFKMIDMVVSVILSNRSFNIQLNMLHINPLYNVSYKNVHTISMRVKNEENKVTSIISNITVNSDHNCFQERLEDVKNLSNIVKSNTINKYTDRSHRNKFENRKSGIELYVSNNRNKKTTFVRLYKKCKSMSNICNERSGTALRKIANLDDFFLALGATKALANVTDGIIERKILTAVKEVKNWINEITPRQALLILLLANKKDTSNLLRYRLVILQGIAVKRITRASELDMEIEVIEREKLNTFSPYEGISYLPASVENQDSLLEELYWIAKTTASDYQKPFDESSERLLKSLLEKRKKLNPSYLRVMARYVGLGLLKSPN
ncbi:uncharacterized protein LOC120632809 isoform X2 [Pararge aegeria]|uniref:uncharacterized protein LOC120632809 isoform X2 n=1 Tax=Pararge aegeria TaxID=116150 RepID=UPI0019D2A5B4|nr:uncharacterized protein LOC120632809 isoform X2 [Pararge aegeria]